MRVNMKPSPLSAHPTGPPPEGPVALQPQILAKVFQNFYLESDERGIPANIEGTVMRVVSTEWRRVAWEVGYHNFQVRLDAEHLD